MSAEVLRAETPDRLATLGQAEAAEVAREIRNNMCKYRCFPLNFAFCGHSPAPPGHFRGSQTGKIPIIYLIQSTLYLYRVGSDCLFRQGGRAGGGRQQRRAAGRRQARRWVAAGARGTRQRAVPQDGLFGRDAGGKSTTKQPCFKKAGARTMRGGGVAGAHRCIKPNKKTDINISKLQIVIGPAGYIGAGAGREMRNK